jgi:anti-sigma factor RsiW
MRCSRIHKRLSAFLDGELPEKERKSISEHLKTCEICQGELEGLSLVSDSLDILGAKTAPPFFGARVKRRVAGLERRRSLPAPALERVRRATIPAAAVALLCLSILAGGGLGRGIYELREEKTSREELELVDFIGAGSFGGLSNGSLGTAYTDLVTAEGE